MSKPTKTDKPKKKDTAQAISEAVYLILKDKKGLIVPTYQDIADITGLSTKTIERHYKDIQFKPLDTTQRALTPFVVNNLYLQTAKSTQAVKLWFQLMEGWRENAEIETEDVKMNISHTIVTRTEPENKEMDFTDDGN